MRATEVFLLVLGYLTLCQGECWKCSEGHQLNGASQAVQIDASLGELVATDTNGQAYSLSGDYWKSVPYANLKHVSVGQAGIWGIGASNKIYKYVGDKWAEVPGGLIQIDAGGDGFVVGVNAGNNIYCLRSDSTMAFNGLFKAAPWKDIGGRLKYFSCGPYGCWGVNSGDAIFFNALTSAATCSFSGWKHIAGGLKMIEVGTDGNAFGVNSAGAVFQRTGITKDLPQGSGWHHISCFGTMKQVSYDLGTIYGVSTTGVIMKATA